jgi:hypothetical protein
MGIKKVIIIDANIKAAEKNLNEVNELLELQDEALKRINKDLKNYENQLEQTSAKDLNRRKDLNEQIKKTRKELTSEKKALTELKGKRTEATKALSEAKSEAVDFGGALQAVDGQTGGAVSGLMALKGGVLNLGKSFKTLDGILKLSLLGLFVTIIGSVVAAFKRSEEGQERFIKLFKQSQVAINNVLDILSDFGTSILNVGKGLLKLAKGDLKGMALAFNDAKENINDAANAIKNFGEETQKEIKIAGQIADQRAKAHHIERDIIVERAKANREINDIRLEAEKRDKYNATERVALLRKAQKIEEDITKKEIKAKKLVIDAQVQEMSLGKNTIQQKDELAKLQAQLIELDTKKLRSQRLLQTQITTAANQEKAEKEKKKKEEQQELVDMVLAATDKETKRQKAIRDVQNAYKQTIKEEDAETELEKIELDKEKAIAELDKLNATKEQRANIIAYWDGKITEAEEKETKKRKALQDKVEAAKVESAMRGMALIQEIAGKGSAVGKAMAIGQATISGIEGVQNAFTTASKSPITTFFPAYPFIQAGLAGSFSALQIKKIASTSADGKGSAPSPVVSGGGSATPVVPSTPPAFNIVGSGGANQLAGAIGEQTQQPVKAFVVANDVTTAQSLDRNIVEGASIG